MSTLVYLVYFLTLSHLVFLVTASSVGGAGHEASSGHVVTKRETSGEHKIGFATLGDIGRDDDEGDASKLSISRNKINDIGDDSVPPPLFPPDKAPRTKSKEKQQQQQDDGFKDKNSGDKQLSPPENNVLKNKNNHKQQENKFKGKSDDKNPTDFWALLDKPRTEEKKQQKVLLVSIDGYRWDLHRIFDTPNIARVLKNGVTVDHVLNVFPTKTLPNHQSIVTGLYPEHHGMVDNGFMDKKTGLRYVSFCVLVFVSLCQQMRKP